MQHVTRLIIEIAQKEKEEKTDWGLALGEKE